jgi:hypothetical protein
MEPSNNSPGQSSTDVNTAAPSTTPGEAVGGSNQPLTGEETQMKDLILGHMAEGLMSRETADVSLQESIGRRLADFENDKRSPTEIAYDKAYPVCREQDIQWPATEETTTPQYSAFRNSINGYFVDAGVTNETAAFILKQADAFGHRSEKWGENDHVLNGRAELAKLQCVFGDQLPQKLELARQMVQKIEAARPGIVAMLEATGLGNDAGVILALANHCARVSTRSQPR